MSGQEDVVSDVVNLLPFQLSKVFTVNSFATFPVCLIGAKVNSPSCQNPFLHYPCSRVKLSLAHILVEIIYISADIELLAGGILHIDKLSAYVPLEEPRVGVDSRSCSDCAVSLRKDGFHSTRFASPVLAIVPGLDDAE